MCKKRFLYVLLSIVLLIAFITSCSGSPTETTTSETKISTTATSESSIATTTTTAAETTTTEAVETEPDPPVADSPELIWTFHYENEDFAPGSIAVHPDGELVTVGAYMATYTHRLYDSELTDVDTDYRHSVDALSFSSDGSYLAAGLSVYGTLVKDLTGETEPLQLHGGYNNFVAFSQSDMSLATGNRTGNIWLWSIPDAEQIAELADEEGDYLWGLAYHPSGEQIASLQWSDDGTINIWSIADEQIIHSMVPEINVGSSNNVIRYSPDGNFFAAYFQIDREHTVRIFDTDQYELLVDLPIEKRVTQISFSPDGQMIAVASIHMDTTIWSAATGELLYTLDQELEATTDGSKALAFTPDGGHLAVIRNSGELELWRLPGAEPLPEPEIDLYQPIPIPGDVLFDTGSSELREEADAVLQAMAEDLLTALPEAKLTFVGHTDSRGDAAANMQLSLDRTTSVKSWFEAWAEDSGADGWTFAVDGKGETQLKTPDVDGEGNFREEAGRVNRRVEIELEPAG